VGKKLFVESRVPENNQTGETKDATDQRYDWIYDLMNR